MKKRGQIWVSAVLYIAMGMIVITLILTAGVPLINKMRDRNTIAQTETVMLNIHNNIQAVMEARGSTRYLSPVDITVGQLLVDEGDSNRIEWGMKTENKLMEPDIVFTRGDLNLELKSTPIEGEYDMTLFFDYTDKAVDLVLSGDFQNPLQGRFSITIRNNGYKTECGDLGPECLEIGLIVTA